MSQPKTILLILVLIVIFLLIAYAFKSVWTDGSKDPYAPIGKRVIIQGDTLFIWKYIPATKQYVLNNG